MASRGRACVLEVESLEGKLLLSKMSHGLPAPLRHSRGLA